MEYCYIDLTLDWNIYLEEAEDEGGGFEIVEPELSLWQEIMQYVSLTQVPTGPCEYPVRESE